MRRTDPADPMRVVLANPRFPAVAGKDDPHTPVYALAGLYTAEDIPRVNDRLRNALDRVAVPGPSCLRIRLDNTTSHITVQYRHM